MTMERDAVLETWLALEAVPGIGPIKAGRLLERVGIDELARLDPAALSDLGLTGPQVQALKHPDPVALERVFTWLAKPNHHLLTPSHPDYPPLLREIDAAPLLLFVIGEPKRLHLPQVAVVGSRSPTPGGRAAAQALSEELVRAGLAVTSGLALGIDGLSHGAALAAGGMTIGVLGAGLSRIYPARHQPLAQEILQQGGVLVSEFRPEQPPKAENFPRRNRIISGLSLGTLVVEAAEQSGSLITARYALEQGRDVFAVPGGWHNPQALGCHRLIQQGAKLVCSIDDILEELGPQLTSVASPIHVTQASSPPQPDLPSRILLDNVGYETTEIDRIAQSSGIPVEDVMRQLIELELAGWIESVPGGYVRTWRG